jgi:hypothetical protein
MKRSAAVWLALVAGLAVSLPVMAQGEGAAGPAAARAAGGGEVLPITRLTLYRSGVAAYERRGSVRGSAGLMLPFSAEQLNDVLKSLQVLDLDGGRVGGVSFASKDPLSRRLESFGVPVGDGPALPVLLNRLRRQVVRVKMGGGAGIEGAVLSVETRVQPGMGKDARPAEEVYLNLVTAEGIRPLSLSLVTSVELVDPALNAELTRALAAMAGARNDRTRTLELALSGEGERRVVVRYVHEAPVWKSAYRLVMGDAEGGGGKGAMTLQGWAIVENTTDSDWTDVRLSLVSNRPVSFTMDLAEPLYLPRPGVPVPVIAGVRPREFGAGEAAVAASPASAPVAQRARREMRAEAADALAGAAMGKAMIAESLSAEELVNASPAAMASAGNAGEVFFFEVDQPVTVQRRRSAMIPFMTAGLSGRRVSVFNPADAGGAGGVALPLRAVEVRNDSGVPLLPGPVTVFDGAAYAGDAQVGQVPPGDKRILAYAVDLELTPTVTPEERSGVTRLKVVDGVIVQTIETRVSTAYAFRNRDAAGGRSVIVEHARRPGFVLEKPAAGEKAGEFERFEVEVSKGADARLEVVESRVEETRLAMTSMDLPTVVALRQDGRASEAVLTLFKSLGERRAALTAAQRELGRLEQEIGQNTTEQERVSRTMAGLPQNSEVYRGYLEQLARLSAGLEGLRERLPAARELVSQRERELEAFVRTASAE